ncbi:high mobility group nucleosome-binding domain-containing protein 5 isoform X2 [Notothenia coriiceps]|uniref:High mobility group nucleosome-binding domain-containing protein 5 isoform X2 n=1 Tax=Notothenia coriiceps TaxID=8208 RepID=A0A6I9PHQ0_9TELE|nr:PREDICTED: high mobility group nucleosome-binding domain-containing protein 5-like isoform X2 [Notothenia coriiceps]
MTIGKNSRKNSARSSIRAPKFLDKSSGFYGRLDEPETPGEGEEVGAQEVEETRDSNKEASSPSVVHVSEKEEVEAFDHNEGMIEDDGETLLQRKPSRRSSRWSRSSRRKQKEGRVEQDAAQEERPSAGTESTDTRVMIQVETGKGKESTMVHFPVREDEDDQVLIREKKRGREEEGEKERRMKKEQEEGLKEVKRSTAKNYRKSERRHVLDA